jgi:hypothetical protein
VRLAPELARSLAVAVLPTAERKAARLAHEAATLMAGGASGARISAQRTRGAGGRRASLGRGRSQRRDSTRIPNACRGCRLILDDERRKLCDDCLPAFSEDRTQRLADAGTATLAAMRASPHDPARTPEARAKLADASRARMRAIRAWEREHGKGFDEKRYQGEVVPAITLLTVDALRARTGLSRHYC